MATLHFIPTPPDASGKMGFIVKRDEDLTDAERVFVVATQGLDPKYPPDQQIAQEAARKLHSTQE